MKIKNKKIGIIGGMGPYASAYFYKLLLKKSSCFYDAKENDDFPEIIIDSLPVPDFISDTKKLFEAKKMLVTRVKKLNDFGVNSIGMICNTGHILYPNLHKISKVKFYSMIDLVGEAVFKLGLKKVGILATPTTVKYDLYGKVLRDRGISVYYQQNGSQNLHEKIIRDMVSGKKDLKDIKNLEVATRKLVNDNNLDGIILGCTELPLVFPKNKFKNVIDCMEVLADKLLEKYYN